MSSDIRHDADPGSGSPTPEATPAPPPAPPPEGFRVARVGGAFVRHNGPLYARMVGSRFQMAFRVEPRHTNPMGVCHGGMLATFADMLVPMAGLYQSEGERRFLPTIGLQIDFLAPVPLGAWVQGEADVLRKTRNLVFGHGLATVDGEPVLRVSGVFKQGPVLGDGSARDPLGLMTP